MTNEEFLDGKFHVSGELAVSDPNQNKPSYIITNAKKGIWRCCITRNNSRTITDIYGYADGFYKAFENSNDTVEVKTRDAGIPTDTGIIGIFELSNYRKDKNYTKEMRVCGSRFFGACCGKVWDPQSCGIIRDGAVSISGDGDGVYPVTTYTDKRTNKVVGVRVQFLK